MAVTLSEAKFILVWVGGRNNLNYNHHSPQLGSGLGAELGKKEKVAFLQTSIYVFTSLKNYLKLRPAGEANYMMSG